MTENNEHTITVYSTPTCSYCVKLKEFFKENNVEFTEKDVTKDQAAMHELMEKNPAGSVPVIDIDGEIIVGFDEGKIKEKLNIAG
ncbi:MAG: NrdH-redoxin [Nanoarchaeota archaeon]|nr:NrdH-redoxin [Nanoarchaeota archaeon]|tara:strand:- start:1678 stop:1932 length:255 start_codon:yes stop_codon:yes gene_type:complete